MKILCALLGLATVSLTMVANSAEPLSTGTPTGFRRLNETQYVHAIRDVFGPDITIPGRFEPSVREGGLLAIGESRVAVTLAGFEQYELRAREIAAQVLSEPRRTALGVCLPKTAENFDGACARSFFSRYGRLLLRRPLDTRELAEVIGAARAATGKTRDFYQGLQAGLSRLMVSPFFVFRVESSEADTSGPGRRLDAYSLASRLSFLLWDAPPDESLLDAAAAGRLYQRDGLAQQVDRMIADTRFEQGVRALFSDMFAYSQFDGLTKEQSIYKKFNSQLARDAKEQSLRTIVDLLVVNDGDYRDLFTTKQTFMNRSLAALYGVPVESAAVDGWAPYTFAAGDSRQGILTLAGFLMMDPSHEGRSSPTIRGKTVRELLLCQPVPPPPANVNFALVQDTSDPRYRTARDRLTAHRDNPVCAGCHRLTDPLGLAMENYDTIGQYRLLENGAPIDASGEVAGKHYKNAIELQSVLHDVPALTSCLARRVYEYGVGNQLPQTDGSWLDYLTQQFAAAGYKLPPLMRTVAESRAFHTVVSPVSPSNRVASN